LTKNKASKNRNGRHCPDYGLLNKLSRFWNWLKPGDKIALFALGVALLSLVFSLYQFYQSDEGEHAKIIPILEIYYMNLPSHYSASIHNSGLGTAIIDNVIFYQNSRSSKNLGDFLNLPYNASGDMFNFKSEIYYISTGAQMILADIDYDDLNDEGYNNSQIIEIMKAWRENINGIDIEIAYQDVLGERQETLRNTINFPPI
jgi:hypothetical protein